MKDIRTYGVPKGEGQYPQEIIYSIALLYHVISNEITAYLKPFDLSIGKFNILVAIRRHGGPEGLRQVEVSQHLIVTPSNMTKMVDKLQAEGFVERADLAGDRRVNMVQLTEKGVELLDAIWGGYLEKIHQAVKQLDETQQKQLASLLTGWFESM